MKTAHINRKATGEQIRKQMEMKGITVKDLSSAIRVSVQSVYGYLRGDKLPTLQHLLEISQILKTPIHDLLISNN